MPGTLRYTSTSSRQSWTRSTTPLRLQSTNLQHRPSQCTGTLQYSFANNPSCLEILIPLSCRPTTAKPVYESLPQAAPQYQAPPKKTYKAPSKPTYTKPSYKAPQPKPQSYR